jgi:hypothetical protein
MNLKLRRPRSCAGWFLSMVGILLLLVLLNNVYAKGRVFMAHMQAKELAVQLGATPERFLRSQVYNTNVDIITGSATCNTALYFETPLSMSDFEQRLEDLLPGTSAVNRRADFSLDIYSTLPLGVANFDRAQARVMSKNPPMLTLSWFLPTDQPQEWSIADFYQTDGIPAEFLYSGQRIDGNIAVIRWNAGRYPIWVLC